jgi:hypothetical protein
MAAPKHLLPHLQAIALEPASCSLLTPQDGGRLEVQAPLLAALSPLLAALLAQAGPAPCLSLPCSGSALAAALEALVKGAALTGEEMEVAELLGIAFVVDRCRAPDAGGSNKINPKLTKIGEEVTVRQPELERKKLKIEIVSKDLHGKLDIVKPPDDTNILEELNVDIFFLDNPTKEEKSQLKNANIQTNKFDIVKPPEDTFNKSNFDTNPTQEEKNQVNKNAKISDSLICDICSKLFANK